MLQDMVLFRTITFYKYFLFWSIYVIIIPEYVSTITEHVVVNLSSKTQQEYALLHRREHERILRPRPLLLLADDAKKNRNVLSSQSNDIYGGFLQPFTSLNMQYIKSLHDMFLNVKNETGSLKIKQVIGKARRNTGYFESRWNNKQSTLFDMVWKMSRKSSDLNTASEEDNTESSLFEHFEKIRTQTMYGSFLEIGGCEFSSDVTTLEKDKTIIAFVQDLKQLMPCYQKVSSIGSKNMYLSALSTEKLQQVIEDVGSDYKILFGTILLEEFLTLSTSLLPHEFEELLARLFSLSLQTFIPNMNITKSSKFFSATETWSSPGQLFTKACKIAGLTCSVDMVWGFDTWEFTKAIYKVTVKKGFRSIHPELCQIVGGYSQCYAEFGAHSHNLTIKFENGNNYTSPIDLNDVQLQMFLKTGPVKLILEELFVKLLYVPYQKLKQGEVFLSGSKLRIKQLSKKKLTQGRQLSKHTAEKKNSTFVKQGEQNTQDKRTVPFVSDKDSIRTDFLWSREKFSRPKTKNGIKLNGLWNREIFSNKHTTSIITNVENHLNRDHEEPKQNSNFKTGDDRISTEEENQIHKGLDYLHESDVDSQNIFIKRLIVEKQNISARMFKDIKYVEQYKKGYVPSSKHTNTFRSSKHMNTKQLTTPVRNTFKPVQKEKIYVNELKEKNVNDVSNKLVSHNILVPLALNINGNISNKMFPDNILNRQRYSTFVNKLSKKPNKTSKTFDKVNNKQKSVLNKLWRRYKQEPSVNDDKVVINGEKHTNANQVQRKLLVFSQPAEDKSNRLKRFLRNYPQNPSHLSEEHPSTSTESTHKSPVNNYKMNMPTLSPSLNEEVLFDSMWKKIKHFIIPVAADKNLFSVFIYGQGHHCLFGRKIALLYPHSSVVTVVPPYQRYVTEKHRKFVNLNSIHNNLLLSSDLTVHLVHDVNRMPEIFKFQMLGLDIFRPMLTLGPAFLYYLGELLTLAQTTFLEIPSFDQLLYVYHLLRINNTQMNMSLTEQTEGLILKALKLVGAEMETTEILGSDLGPNLIVIRIKAVERKIQTACGEHIDDGYLTLLPDGVISLKMQNVESESSGRIMKGIGLEMLLRIGLPSKERMHLFKKYLELEIHQDMCPSHIVWIKQRLMYLPIGVEMQASEETKHILLSQLQNELVDKRFSFMEYNSQESVGLHLAKWFPNSSFLALSENTDTGTEMYDIAIKRNITNFLTTILSLDTTFTTKLLRSPDILRYQFIGYDEFLRLLQVFSKESFRLYIGQILSTGLSTFIQVPSSKILSLAASTFYPEVVLTKPFSFHIYDADSHPLPLFFNSESKLLYENAKADVEIEITQEVLPEQFTNDGSQLPWRLVRVDIKRLKVMVDHHFDFELDGHKRKYFQHVISENKSHYEVYLIREIDGFKIPYGQINAISLIALLRMGLLTVIKDRFYEEFLNLPLYEDMAPWNIVFRGGKLEYIDYDTKDVTFDKMVPAAYQIMAVLMNYERTVFDFGHCIAPAENQYGFEFISHCVGSKFKGPCPDSRYPVPCSDNRCKATYIDCLRSLELLEHQYRGRSYKTTQTVVKHGQSFIKWAFNHDGLVKPHD